MLPRLPEIDAALDDLAVLAADNGVAIGIDLADLRGYHYHTGVMFAAYCEGLPSAVALGGRYDEVGKAFGRARPATGFSMDLRVLAQRGRAPAARGAILAPFVKDPALAQKVESLRRAGEVVIADLPGHDGTRDELGCDRRLVRRGDGWEIEVV
jgi:ATP phosphoribosyltransferase regulatory subunit